MTEAGISAEDAVRERIKLEAHDLFVHYGFAKTSMADIAGRTQMSAANIYRYFRNKQAIAIACAADFFAKSEAGMMAELRDDRSAADNLRAMIHLAVGAMLSLMDDEPKIMELIEFLHEDPEGSELVGRHIEWQRERIGAEIARGVARGEFRPCDPAVCASQFCNAHRAFLAPTSLALWWEREQIPADLDGVLDLCLEGLAARA